MRILTLAALLLISAQDKEPTCHETAERVLQPFEKSLEAAKTARKQYADSNGKAIAKIEEYINRLRKSIASFKEAQEKDRKYYDDRIGWTKEAIAEITKRVQKEMADFRKNGNEEGARKKAEELAAGKSSGHKRELGYSNSINGWKKDGAKLASDRDKKMKNYAAGKVGKHHKLLGYGGDRTHLEELLRKQQEKLGKTRAREFAHHLRAIGYSLNGQGIDKLVADKTKKLAEVKGEIAAGTWVLHVRTLGYSTSRNHVQKLIADKKAEYWNRKDQWGRGEFGKHNNKAGYTITNGKIGENLAAARKALADYRALGEEAPAHAGYSVTGKEIRKRIADAKKAGNDTAKLQKWYADWQKAKAKHIKYLEDAVKRWEEILKLHEELYKEELAARQKELNTRWKRALAETPCGGGSGVTDPKKEVVDRERAKLDKLHETEEEGKRRREQYDDEIYVEKDGTIHGDPKRAWQNALRDVMKPKPESPPDISRIIQAIKAAISAYGNFTGETGFSKANQQIEEFLRMASELEGLSGKELRQKKNEIRKAAKALLKQLEGGALSPARVQGLIQGLTSNKKPPKNVREAIAQLRKIDSWSGQLKTWFNSGWGRNLLKNVGAAIKDTKGMRTKITNAAVAAAKDVGGQFFPDWKKMSKFQKGVWIFNTTEAAWNVYTKVQGGMAVTEAIAREGTDMFVDALIGMVPVVAVGDMIVGLIGNAVASATGDPSYTKASVSAIVKELKEMAFDKIAQWAASAGDSRVLDRYWYGEKSMKEILANTSFERLRRYLSTVESRIDALPPGHPDEARLMRTRRTFRELLRAKQQG